MFFSPLHADMPSLPDIKMPDIKMPDIKMPRMPGQGEKEKGSPAEELNAAG